MLGRILVIGLMVAVSVSTARAQTKDNLPEERAASKEAARVEQAMARFERTVATDQVFAGPLSFRNFVRGGIATGNLIQVPYVTNVNVSAGYFGGSVSPNNITWPKGSGVQYGHTMSFLVAGEVLSEGGDTLHIISESYNRGGGDAHPSGSHKYFYTALPGFYNMSGNPATKNRLNNNPDDRRLLDETGNCYVGGISEDRNNNGELDPGEDLNRNGKLDLELINEVEYAAQSNLPQTWPRFWPAGSYVGDSRQHGDCVPGLRAGRWNGQYGAYVRGDQEVFYTADDRDNDEFPYYPFLDPATGAPDRRPWAQGGRRGLGVEVDVRHYQWASVLAEDIFIGTFDVLNVSHLDINRSIISMMVDYDIAGRTGDNQALFDTKDDITYQWYKRDLTINGFKVGYGGVGFLESPGIDGDGVDNDLDGLIDESQENGIDDDGDWRTWEDINLDGVYEPGLDLIWDDVGSDGIGPEDEDYPGPDPDGTEANGIADPGEPNFEFTDNDEIDQIGLTNMVIRTPTDFDRDLDDDALFWDEYIQPVDESQFIVPIETNDVIYVYSSGFATIPQGAAQRFSLAWFCGNDFQDMLRNKRTMQNIYDADYSFARPPRTPIVKAVAGDKKVTLIWEQSAELSRDPIYGQDFEMYKVYRSTEPEFNEIKTITDAFGNPLLWEPLRTSSGDKVQYDLKNGLFGAHPVPVGAFGISYDMGTDSGLKYHYIDDTVENGRTYYYAVVSVDHGYHNSFFDLGVSVLQNLAETSPTESSKIIEVDAFDRPTNIDRNCAVVVPQPAALGYMEAQLVDGIQKVGGKATGALEVEFLAPDEANSKGYEYEFSFSDDGVYAALDPEFLSGGNTTGFVLRNLTTGDTLAVSQEGARGQKIFDSPILNAHVYDGMKFSITNPTGPTVNRSVWLENNAGQRSIATPRSEMVVSAPGDNTAVPRDYEIRVSAIGADTSNSLTPSRRTPANFAVFDVTNLNSARKMPMQLTEPDIPPIPGDSVRGVLSPGDVLNVRVFKVDLAGYSYYARSTWRFTLGMSQASAAYIGQIDGLANDLYDSLAVKRIRGFQRRAFGPDLDRKEILPFFRRLDPWFEGTRDSLMGIPGIRDLVAEFPVPASFFENIDRIIRTEIPIAGDRFVLEVAKPFDRDDKLRFKVDGNRMAEEISENALDEIHVVPDPYVAVNSLEPRNLLLSGRGERRIDFRNLPRQCTIRIFTMSGRLLRVIEHDAPEDQSIAPWNLQSDDGLDVSYGVYIYHVDAPGIGEKVGRFAIIK